MEMTYPFRLYPFSHSHIRTLTHSTSHLAQLFQEPYALVTQFALLDKFLIVLPPIKQTAIYHPPLVGQVVVLLDEGFEKLIVAEPFDFTDFHGIGFS